MRRILKDINDKFYTKKQISKNILSKIDLVRYDLMTLM